MFTGIVEHLGAVVTREVVEHGAVLEIDVADWVHNPVAGESIAVNGCCLTVVDPRPDRIRFDVIRQTLEVTTLGHLDVGDPVNLEAALTPSTRLGGHFVQGHVDGVGSIERVVATPVEHRLRMAPPRVLMPLLVVRGSVALDGVSLTVAGLDDGSFDVALIPTTLAQTTLGRRATGDRVNIEADYLAKVVQRLLAEQASQVVRSG